LARLGLYVLSLTTEERCQSASISVLRADSGQGFNHYGLAFILPETRISRGNLLHSTCANRAVAHMGGNALIFDLGASINKISVKGVLFKEHPSFPSLSTITAHASLFIQILPLYNQQTVEVRQVSAGRQQLNAPTLSVSPLAN
jgi:hypothetical protein